MLTLLSEIRSRKTEHEVTRVYGLVNLQAIVANNQELGKEKEKPWHLNKSPPPKNKPHTGDWLSIQCLSIYLFIYLFIYLIVYLFI